MGLFDLGFSDMVYSQISYVLILKVFFPEEFLFDLLMGVRRRRRQDRLLF